MVKQDEMRIPVVDALRAFSLRMLNAIKSKFNIKLVKSTKKQATTNMLNFKKINKVDF